MSDKPDKPPIASETVLEETPGRVLTFLRAIANNSVIYGQLAAAGFIPSKTHSSSGTGSPPPRVHRPSSA